MWKEEVSFLQADCWMERLRDGQTTIGGRPGPECRLGETHTPLRVGSGRAAKCTQKRPSQRIWQGDPFTHPSTPIHLLPARSPFSLHPSSNLTSLPPFVDTQLGGDELTQRVKTSLGVLSPLSRLHFWRTDGFIQVKFTFHLHILFAAAISFKYDNNSEKICHELLITNLVLCDLSAQFKICFIDTN